MEVAYVVVCIRRGAIWVTFGAGMCGGFCYACVLLLRLVLRLRLGVRRTLRLLLRHSRLSGHRLGSTTLGAFACFACCVALRPRDKGGREFAFLSCALHPRCVLPVFVSRLED